MRNAKHRALVLLQMLLQPVNRLGIQVVCRLVQEQHIGLLQQQPTKCHTTALSATEFCDFLVVRWTAQCVHGDAQFRVELPCIQCVDFVLHRCLAVHQLLHFIRVVQDLFVHELHVDLLIFLQDVHNFLSALLNHLAHRFGFVQFRFLRQVTDRVPLGPHHLSLKGVIQSRDDLHHGGLSRPVVSDDANFGSVKERQVNVLQDVLAGGGRLVDPHHAENDFFVVRHG